MTLRSRTGRVILPLCMLGFALAGSASAQDSPADSAVVLRALPGPDRVVLRWGPTVPAIWLAAKSAGYRIERAQVDSDGEIDGNFRPLTASPILPWTPEEWEAAITAERMFAAVAYQALHGESFAPQPSAGFIASMRSEATELNFRFGFSMLAADLDSLAAEGLGVRWVDEDVSSGATYLYRAYLAGDGSQVRADTGYALVETVSQPPAVAPSGFGAVPGDGRVLLGWNRTTEGAPLSAYRLERSADAGRTWEQLTESPIVPAADPEDVVRYIDSTVANYRTYRYRLSGIDPFALTTPPAEVEVIPRDLTPPPAPLFETARHVEESTVSLSWTVEPVGDLAGFQIGIGDDPEGPFDIAMDRILPPDARSAEDSRAVSHLLNYYVVVALDTAGNAAPSQPRFVHVVDTVPPAPPVGLSVADVDTSGAVRIAWQRGDEPDLYGYRIFRANQPDHTFTLRTGEPLQDTLYVDSIEVRSLSRDVYYRLTALDRNFNASETSEVLHVRLPDVVAPVAPAFAGATPTDSSIHLVWVPSSSSDIRAQLLMRREAGVAAWEVAASLNPTETNYIDLDVFQRRTYEYTLVAEDSSGLRSPAALPVHARPYDTGVRMSIERLTASVDSVRKTVRLAWDYPDGDGEYWFVIYRGAAGGPLTRYRSAGGERTYEDVEVRLRTEEAYRYAVQVLYRDGGSSPLSEVVAVEYPR